MNNLTSDILTLSISFKEHSKENSSDKFQDNILGKKAQQNPKFLNNLCVIRKT